MWNPGQFSTNKSAFWFSNLIYRWSMEYIEKCIIYWFSDHHVTCINYLGKVFDKNWATDSSEICLLTNIIIISLLSNLTNLSRNPSNKPEIRECAGNSWILEWKEPKHQGRVRFTLENMGRWWNLWMSSMNADCLFDEWSSLAMQCVHSSCWREIAVCHFRLQVNHLYSLSFLECWRE